MINHILRGKGVGFVVRGRFYKIKCRDIALLKSGLAILQVNQGSGVIDLTVMIH